jgi:hypothetical protein
MGSSKDYAKQYSLETVCQVWDDKAGERIDVQPDRDGLGLIEVVSFSKDGKEQGRLVMPKEQAELLMEALDRVMEAGR